MKIKLNVFRFIESDQKRVVWFVKTFKHFPNVKVQNFLERIKRRPCYTQKNSLASGFHSHPALS